MSVKNLLSIVRHTMGMDELNRLEGSIDAALDKIRSKKETQLEMAYDAERQILSVALAQIYDYTEPLKIAEKKILQTPDISKEYASVVTHVSSVLQDSMPKLPLRDGNLQEISDTAKLQIEIEQEKESAGHLVV